MVGKEMPKALFSYNCIYESFRKLGLTYHVWLPAFSSNCHHPFIKSNQFPYLPLHGFIYDSFFLQDYFLEFIKHSMGTHSAISHCMPGAPTLSILKLRRNEQSVPQHADVNLVLEYMQLDGLDFHIFFSIAPLVGFGFRVP